MNNSMIKLLTLLIVMCLSVGILLTGCNGDKPETTDPIVTTDPNTTPSETPTEPEPTETDTEVVQEWNGFFASCFTGSLKDYTGEIDGVSFQGLLMEQPQTVTLTKAAVKSLRLYARENGFDGLRVHTYINQDDNVFTVNGVQMEQGTWSSTDIYLGYLNSLTQFTSHCSGQVENYMWFEFIQMPAINETSFEGPVTPFKGTVGGVTFDGYVFRSVEYQPTVYFNEESVEDIKAYAEANGFNALRISCYPIQRDNCFMVGGYGYDLNKWTTKDFDVTKLSTEFAFWSQSQGLTENYMIFEFVNSQNPIRPYGKEGPPTPSSPYFNGNNQFSVQTYKGTVAGVEFDGYLFKSTHYQPTFYFSSKGISAIRASAKETGNNFLRIHVHPILLDNGFVVGDAFAENNKWTTVDIHVDKLSTDMQFWSQSQGTTDVYMWFEMYSLDIPEKGLVDSTFFQPSNNDEYNAGQPYSVAFSDYAGKVGDVVINGVYVRSADYQPHFNFTQDGIDRIKTYAVENDVDTMTISAYAILYNNGFVLNNQIWLGAEWKSIDVDIATLTTAFDFWSCSEGISEIYLTFDFYKAAVINPASFTGKLNFESYEGEVGGKQIVGIKATSHEYQPHFNFTQGGIDRIKAYAAENDVDTLKISAYAILYNNSFVFNNQIWLGAEWKSIDIDIASLTTEFDFFSGSESTTEVYLTFEFYKAAVINPASFTGKLNFESFEGEVGGKQIVGIMATSHEYQPHFNFTQGGIDRIKAYAAENNVDTLRISAYAILYNNGFVLNNQIWLGAEWKSIDVDIATLTTAFDFWSCSESTSEIYLTFEFYKADVINPASFIGKVNFETFEGEVGGKQIVGIKATSHEYQPHFNFTQGGIDRIKVYAAENGFNTLRISAYAILYNNLFVLDNQIWVGAEWKSMNVDIDTLTTEFDFFSGSESTTEVYLAFEFLKTDTINSDSFQGTGLTFENFEGTVGGKSVKGIKVTGAAGQHDFSFAEIGVNRIVAYANKNDVNYLSIKAFANSGSLAVENQVAAGEEWIDLEVNLLMLNSDFTFTIQSDATAEIYLTFDFIKKEIIRPDSFGGAFSYEAFTGTVAEKEISGIKIIGTGRTRDAFTAEALEEIKLIAQAKGYTELKIQVYVTLDNNAFTLFGQPVTQGEWNEITISIDSLTTSSRIQTTCTGNTEAYFVFEFQ